MKVTKTYFMLMASDVRRGASFYKNALGLKPGGHESPEWTELVQNGTTVALQKRPEVRPNEGISIATAVDSEGNLFSIVQELPRS